MSRKGKLIKVSRTAFPKLFSIEVEEVGALYCWGDKDRVCKSDCTAWSGSNKAIRCSAIPDKASQIIVELKEEE